MTSQNQARLQLVVAALLFSTGGAAIKASTLSGWQVASFRSGVAAVTLLLLVPATRRGWGWRPALVGVAYAATLILFVTANKLTTSANTIFLQATSPVYLLLLGPLFLQGAGAPARFLGRGRGARRTGALLRRQRGACRHGTRSRHGATCWRC